MDYRELYTFVSETRKDILDGVREDNVLLYGSRTDGVVLSLVGTRKQRRKYPNDFYVSAPGWDYENPSWSEVLHAASALNNPIVLDEVVEALARGESPEEAASALTVPGDSRSAWLRFAQIVQPMALQEDLNYYWANGQWTPFHLLKCLALGADVEVLAAGAKAMNGRALCEDDCEACDACDRAMWRTTWPDNQKLRRYYA